MYRIVWSENRTDRSGFGRPHFDTRDVAELVARQMNRDWPEFRHWVEEVDAPAPAYAEF